MNRFQKIIERFNLLETEGDLLTKRKAEEKRVRRKIKKTSLWASQRDYDIEMGILALRNGNTQEAGRLFTRAENYPLTEDDSMFCFPNEEPMVCETLVTTREACDAMQRSAQRIMEQMFPPDPPPDLQETLRGNSRTPRANNNRRPT